MTRTDNALRVLAVIILVELESLDILLTNMTVGHGSFEANPLMAWSAVLFGAWWWAPKAAVTVIVAGFIAWIPRFTWPIALMVVFAATGMLSGLWALWKNG